MKKLLTQQREQVRERYFNHCKVRQHSISVKRGNIQQSHRVLKETYDMQYAHEMKQIAVHELELKSILATKVKYHKETDEAKLDMSKAALAMERVSNAATIRQADRDCDNRIESTKAYVQD